MHHERVFGYSQISVILSVQACTSMIGFSNSVTSIEMLYLRH